MLGAIAKKKLSSVSNNEFPGSYMRLSSKVLIISALVVFKVVLSACDDDDTSSSSGSSGGSVNLNPIIHNTSYANCSETQSATICQGADVYYAQYEECMYTYVSDPSTQAQCEGYYSPAYTETAQLCMDTVAAIGC